MIHLVISFMDHLVDGLTDLSVEMFDRPEDFIGEVAFEIANACFRTAPSGIVLSIVLST